MNSSPTTPGGTSRRSRVQHVQPHVVQRRADRHHVRHRVGHQVPGGEGRGLGRAVDVHNGQTVAGGQHPAQGLGRHGLAAGPDLGAVRRSTRDPPAPPGGTGRWSGTARWRPGRPPTAITAGSTLPGGATIDAAAVEQRHPQLVGRGVEGLRRVQQHDPVVRPAKDRSAASATMSRWRDRDALRHAGRPGRVHHVRQVGRVHGHDPPGRRTSPRRSWRSVRCGRTRRRTRHRLVGDQHRRAGRHGARSRSCGRAGVQRQVRAAGLEHRQLGDHQLRPTAPAAAPPARPARRRARSAVRQAVRAAIQLRVGQVVGGQLRSRPARRTWAANRSTTFTSGSGCAVSVYSSSNSVRSVSVTVGQRRQRPVGVGRDLLDQHAQPVGQSRRSSTASNSSGS